MSADYKIINQFSLKTGNLDVPLSFGGKWSVQDSVSYLSVIHTDQFVSYGVILARNAKVLVTQPSRACVTNRLVHPDGRHDFNQPRLFSFNSPEVLNKQQ